MIVAEEAVRGRARGLVRATTAILMALAVVSCVGIKPPASTMLTKDSNWAPKVQYRPGALPDRSPAAAKSEDVLLIAALSGGGKRSAAFAYGALQTLHAAPVELSNEARQPTQSTILKEVDIVSGVSGGALTASYYALHREQIFRSGNMECSFEHFLYEDTGAKILGLYLMPWKWGWAFDEGYGSNDVMADFFAKRLFSDVRDCPVDIPAERVNGATFEDLYNSYRAGSPFLILESTDVTRGIVFPYHQDSFDFLCSDVSQLPLGWALAGSNGFPAVLSTVGLENHHAKLQGTPDLCRPKDNSWLRRTMTSEQGCRPMEDRMDQSNTTTGLDERLFRSNLLEDVARCYVWPNEAAYAHLADGGMTDNFALKGLTDWFVMHDGDRSFMHVVHLTRRIQILVIDGQREIDGIISKSPTGPNFFQAIDSMISNGVDQGNVASFSEIGDVLRLMSGWLEIRDLVIAQRAWDKHLRNATTGSKAPTFDAFIGRPDFFLAFETEFNAYTREVLELERKAKEGDQASLDELEMRDSEIKKLRFLRRLGEWVGSIPGDLDWERVGKVVGAYDQEQLLSASGALKRKLQLLATGRAVQKAQMTDLVKVSLVDDCNTKRKRKLLNSPTGLGIDEDIIAAAIQAGREVTRQHLDRITGFIQNGDRVDVPSCAHWSGATPAIEGAKTANPPR